MKRVEELGISPHPWDSHMQFVIANDDRSIVAASNLYDASLIAASPELYEALRDATERRCKTCELVNDDGACEQPDCDCVVQQWKRVLAKASGEEAK